MKTDAPRILLGLLTLAFGVAVGFAMLAVLSPSAGLATRVGAHLAASGVPHPVTAVLLNFRGYDTLLEVAVLVLALLGVLSVRTGPSVADETAAPSPLLAALARGLLPPMLLVAAYLLWRGVNAPGGAFQAAAVLAGALVLARLAQLVPVPRFGLALRLAVLFGFTVFLSVAVVAMHRGALLEYPRDAAGTLILLVEACLTLSIALILALLFASADVPSRHASKAGERP